MVLIIHPMICFFTFIYDLLLIFVAESLRKQRSEFSGKSGEGVTTDPRNNTLNRNTDKRKGKTFS